MSDSSEDLLEVRAELASLLDRINCGAFDPAYPVVAETMWPVPSCGWVYLVRAKGTRAVKIGHTTSAHPQARIDALQTGCPHELVLEAAFAGSQDDERALHACLADRLVRGEWFALHPEEARHIESCGWRGADVQRCPECSGVDFIYDNGTCWHCRMAARREGGA